jgi:hypothetical protein
VSACEQVSDPFDLRYQTACFYLSKPVSENWSRFAILTAYNPYGTEVSLEDNVDASQRLKGVLGQRGIECMPIIGAAPSGGHEEPGFGLNCQQNEVIELARLFKQIAYYWVSDGRIFLMATSGNEGMELGAWSPRIRSVEDLG